MKVLIGIAVALVAHTLVGWPFSLLGGAVVGYLLVDRGWLWGGVAVGSSWALLIAYTYLAAAGPTVEMIRVMAAILGNMPEPLFVVLTIFTGCVLGVCGGLQMLGEALIDPDGIDGNGPGLGLLPLVTVFEPAKTVRRTSAAFGQLTGTWAPLSGVRAQGYEIHHGQTAQHPAMAAKGDVARGVMPGIAWQNPAGNVLGVYLHGLFEDAAVLHALFGAQTPTLDAVFDGLADGVARHFEPGVLDALIA